MEENLTVLKMRGIPFVINRDVTIDKETVKNLQMSILLILQYQKGDDAIGLHAVMRFSLGETEILRGGCTFIAEIKNWKQIEKSDDGIRKNESVLKMLSYATAFINGVCYRETAGTNLNAIALPYIPAEELAKDLYIQDVTQKQS